LDRNRLEEIDAQQTSKEIRDATEASEMMGGMIKAAADAGVNLNSKSEPTKAQEEAMANAMMPMIHKKFQRQKTELIQDRKCLERAKTFAQAKQCERGENRGEDTISVWNATEKKKILGLIDEGIEAMDCAMHAKSMAVIEQCFPNEK
jgi:hypothetical protein